MRHKLKIGDSCNKCNSGVYKVYKHIVNTIGLSTIYKCDNCEDEIVKIDIIEKGNINE